ncbi:MAG: thioredoxin family protein [Clostridiales bacterium]|nr:thioredoxin family protein [Clostridiales bacterium]
MDIKVIGAGCDKCGKLYTNTLDALSELGVEVPVEKVEGLREIVLLGVMSSPALMVDGKLLIAGRVAGKGEILDLLRPYLP